jgi:hypothetical protein
MLCAALALLASSGGAQGACCYFSAKNTDILQPAQKVFITWDPKEKVETFTVQPKFEGNALDFGMVIPTPSQPKLHEMPRDFFRHLAVYTIMKQRSWPTSKLLPLMDDAKPADQAAVLKRADAPTKEVEALVDDPKQTVRVLETGVVGSLDYKIIEAGKADDLFRWLKENKYHYSGDEATLAHYIAKKWIFTVMKIDTMQMKRNQDGTFAGDVSPTRFQFASDKLVYPLKITQISVRERTEALFYIQAPFKTDLPGDMTYQYTWVPMLQSASGCTPGGLPGRGGEWLAAYQDQIPPLLARAAKLDFKFLSGQRSAPNQKGHIPTTMEWARKLHADDLGILTGKSPYSETMPDVDDGYELAQVVNLNNAGNLNNARVQKYIAQNNINQEQLKAQLAVNNNSYNRNQANAIGKVINTRLAKAMTDRPFGYLVRQAPAEDVKNLAQLSGHLQADGFITKFRKVFARDEMNDDLLIVPARYNGAEDSSEYQEMLPTSPP